jgi:hypothetical protein
MQLYASRNNHFLYIITFLDSLLLEGLQAIPSLKQIVSFDIGLKYIISDYNQGQITWELCTRAPTFWNGGTTTTTTTTTFSNIRLVMSQLVALMGMINVPRHSHTICSTCWCRQPSVFKMTRWRPQYHRLHHHDVIHCILDVELFLARRETLSTKTHPTTLIIKSPLPTPFNEYAVHNNSTCEQTNMNPYHPNFVHITQCDDPLRYGTERWGDGRHGLVFFAWYNLGAVYTMDHEVVLGRLGFTTLHQGKNGRVTTEVEVHKFVIFKPILSTGIVQRVFRSDKQKRWSRKNSKGPCQKNAVLMIYFGFF